MPRSRSTQHNTTTPPGLLRRASWWWVDGWWSVPRKALFGAESRAMAADASRLLGQLADDFRCWRLARRESPRALSYDQMLAAWGIDADDAPRMVGALKGARLRITVVCMTAYCALLTQLALDEFNSLAYLLIALACVVALCTSAVVISWRLQCLQSKRYQEFPSWIGARLRIFRRRVR